MSETDFAAARAAEDTARMVALLEAEALEARSRTAEAFLLTHAYVLSLEAGLPTRALLERLQDLGAES